MRSLILLFTFVACAAWADDKMIIVTSSAEKSIEPDMVTLTAEVWSKASSAKQAQSLNAAEFQKLKKSLESFKVKKEDTQTENYSLNPEYVYDQKYAQNRLVGFSALQNVTVILHKTEDLGAFLDSVITNSGKEAGINVNSIQWDTDKRTSLELAALGEAVKNGHQQADELAKAAGVRLKGVTVISHGVAAPSPGPVRPMMRALQVGAANTSTEVMPGQVKVHVDVTTQYEIQ